MISNRLKAFSNMSAPQPQEILANPPLEGLKKRGAFKAQ